ncbi:MAG: WxcM-like domain-containing protein [Candidatus Parcubacteria bacterium]|nr:WxcM-like domain-containing protein [Burkholderiales bacterium]
MARRMAVAKPRVRGVRIGNLASVSEARGRLVAVQVGMPLPFVPQRCFVIMDVPGKGIRGEHAHIKLKQFLVCLKGRVTVLVDDGRLREEIVLRDPAQGLYVPPLVWAAQYNYSADAVLIVFASAKYDPRDYIRDYREFRRRVKR